MATPRKTVRLLVAVLVIFVAGLATGVRTARDAQRGAIAELLADARRCAMAFDPAEMRRLTGTREDSQAASYLAVKDRLIRLRAAYHEARSISLVRHLPEQGRTVLLVDSTPADSDEAARPGDALSDAQMTPGLRAILRTGEPAFEGPVEDGKGEWVRAYAPVFDHSLAPAKGARDILGLAVSAAHWRSDHFAVGARTALYTWLLGGLVLGLAAALYRRGALYRQVRQLATAFEQSHSAAMIVGLDDRIEYVNASLCRQGGYAREELLGRDWRRLKSLDAPEPPFDEMLHCVYSGHSWVGHWSNGRKDGSSYPVRGILSPVEDSRGRPVGFIAVFDDMTSLKQREAELREAKERARAGERAKGQFLATMSHEVRTPLNGIVGFTSLLLDTPLTPEQRDYVQTIRTSGEALIHLTAEILDYSRLGAGCLELKPAPCDPRGVVEETLEIFASAAAEKHLELLHRVGADVPARIRIDPARLRQVLVNLVGNAVKFTAVGEIEVVVRRAGEQLAFIVRDTGPGIAAADAEKIFGPFDQVDASATRRHGGVGLGLAISRSLATALGGGIAVSSEPGRGATFTLTVRFEELEAARPIDRVLAGRRVALVGRHEALRRELAWLLQEWGAEPIICQLEELATAAWDMALVDGDDETRALIGSLPTKLDGGNERPAFCLVSVLLPGAVRRGLHSRFRALLNKPLRHEVLRDVLVGALTPDAPGLPPAAQGPFGLHVLVVEDNRVNQTLLQRILDTLGCEWITVPNGRRAIEELALHSYDLVLMDLHMPELDGLSATRRIRAGEAGAVAREVWIAIVSADARPEQRERAFTAGANDYFQKPVTLTDVQEALRRYLTERRQVAR